MCIGYMQLMQGYLLVFTASNSCVSSEPFGLSIECTYIHSASIQMYDCYGLWVVGSTQWTAKCKLYLYWFRKLVRRRTYTESDCETLFMKSQNSDRTFINLVDRSLMCNYLIFCIFISRNKVSCKTNSIFFQHVPKKILFRYKIDI